MIDLILPYLKTFMISMIPFLESRFSIPIGHLSYGLSITQAALISSLGGVMVAAFGTLLFSKIVSFAEKRIPFLHRILQKLIRKTHDTHFKKFRVMGEVVLVFFIAAPLPGTGVYTAVIVSYLLGLRFWNSFTILSLGVMLQCAVVGFILKTGVNFWDLLFV